MLLPGTEVDKTHSSTCYIPILKQEFGTQKTNDKITSMFANKWLIGSHVISKYYIYFDMSRGYVGNIPRIGIGLKNPNYVRENKEKP
jgi:hypothetical protein